MATNNIRWAAVTRVVELLGAKSVLGNVQIEPGVPAMLMDEIIHLSDIEGEVKLPLMSSGRKYRDDDFRMEWTIRTGHHATVTEAAERGAAMLGALEDVLADDPSLGSLDGVIHAWLSEVKGPLVLDLGSEGRVCILQANVEVKARLS